MSPRPPTNRSIDPLAGYERDRRTFAALLRLLRSEQDSHAPVRGHELATISAFLAHAKEGSVCPITGAYTGIDLRRIAPGDAETMRRLDVVFMDELAQPAGDRTETDA